MSALEQARTHYEAGDFEKARAAAVEGLSSAADDIELLRLAGRAGVETGAPDAVDQLTKVTEVQPESAEAWRDLADALAAEGRTEEAEKAFQKVLEIEPEDEVAQTALGHTAFQAGRRDDAVALLEQVAGRSGGVSTAHVSLVDMYRAVGQPEEALAAARKIVDADPGNALAALDVAELSLDVGRPDEAAEAFGRLRELTDLPEDEVAALQGMIKAALRNGDEQRALELAREAGAIDTVGRTTAVLAHLELSAGDGGGQIEVGVARGQSTAFLQALEAPPSRDEIETLVDATLADFRRKLTEDDRSVTTEDVVG
ncbi:MAG TPA: tetratricopeptide repeat protein [Thermoleophilaceae bacterium]|nr:tetratricopeptide repeat protein [Thermoleophilaceae bacterium]